MIFIFDFQRISEKDYLKKDCCVRQNKVIERIIGHYWYLLYQKISDTSWKLAAQLVLLVCIDTYHCCQVLINFVNQSMADSSTSSGLGGMSGGPGQYCCVAECGSARYDKFGNKTQICSSFHPKIRSLKSTKVESKLLVCIEEEVVETRLTHLAKIHLYVNTILRKNI